MIKIYKSDRYWVGECTSLNLMVSGDTTEEAINKLCDVLKDFLLESYHRGKLKKILDDQ